MRPNSFPRLLLISALLLVGGCSSNNTGKIEGTEWSSAATTIKGQPLPGGALELKFAKDGKLVYRAGPLTFTGTYSLGFGDTVTLHLDQELAGSKTHAEKVAIAGDRLTMTDSDGTQLVFLKTK